MKFNRSRRKRGILFLDLLRGLAVVNMIAYHLLYDLVYIFGINIQWFSITKCYVWEQFICFTFILISGISFRCSKRPGKNGIRLLVCAAVLTAVTALVISDEVIWFGILHFLGLAILLTWLLSRLFVKIPAAAGFILVLTAFILLKHLPEGWIGIRNLWTVRVPGIFYENTFLFFLGFPGEHFFSADYFPLLPWVFLFWTGYFGAGWWFRFSKYLDKRNIPKTLAYRLGDSSLGAVGRKSLIVYMLHQPVIYGILLLLEYWGKLPQ